MKWTDHEGVRTFMPSDGAVDRMFDELVAFARALPGVRKVNGGGHGSADLAGGQGGFGFGLCATFFDDHTVDWDVLVQYREELTGPSWTVEHEIDWDAPGETDGYPIIPLGRCTARSTEELLECLKEAATAFLREPCLSFAAAGDQNDAARIAAQYEEGRQRCSDPR